MTYHVSYGAGDVLYCYNMSNAKMTCPSQDEGQKHLFLCEEGCISLKTSSKKNMFSFKKKNEGAVLFFLKMGHQMLLF